MTRHNLSSLRALYDQPFFDLISQARATYRQHWPEHEARNSIRSLGVPMQF